MASGKSKTFQRLLLFICTAPFLLIASWCAWNIYTLSNERSEIKRDFSEINGIEYGLLSVNAWKGEIEDIISRQIDEFELSPSQDSLLQVQINEILLEMIHKGDSILQHDDNSVKEKLRKWGYNLVVDKEDLKSEVPEFSRTITRELTKPESKERLKKIAKEKLDQFASKTYDRTDSLKMKKFFAKYDAANMDGFNSTTLKMASRLQENTYRYTFALLGIVGLFLLPWILVYRRKMKHLRKPLFVISVILALIVLSVGLLSAMIEIDARIARLDFMIMGESIQFKDQMLFYRSKSILEVVQILIKTNKADSILVGFLIFAFSVLLPVSKLISTEIYLLGKEKIRKNKLVYWLAMKSGKWSMADVMVVAIFMAYVGFSGILDNQLEALNIEDESLHSIATNLTSLQPGFILFLTFVLYSLILSQILKWITPKLQDPLESTTDGI